MTEPHAGGTARSSVADRGVVGTALARYAARFHAAAGGGHHVGSPLGAWLILALCASAAGEPERSGLVDALGVDAAIATRVAKDLLSHPHPAVPSAAAVWTAAGPATPELERWASSLPPSLTVGALPTRSELDTWAREHTLGLIDRFPLTIGPATLLVLATALATRVSWDPPFDLSPAADLGPDSPWSDRVTTVLRTPKHGHRQFIASTEQAGDVAVHAVRAHGGVTVVSVIADQQVPPAAVLAAAHALAPAVALHDETARRSLFELPLGAGPAWTVTEQPTDTAGRTEACTAVLPAWSAESEHLLADPELGFPAAAAVLSRLVGGRVPFEAAQLAVARYTRVGFEAGAVSAILQARSGRRRAPGVLRSAEPRFGHPYAVVAVTTGYPADGPRADPPGPSDPDPWHGLPVFSAWVGEPDDAAETDRPAAQ